MRRRLLAAGFVAIVGAGALSVANPASAQWSSTGFNADDLSTWQTNGVAWATANTGGKVFVGGTFTGIRPAGAASGTSTTAVQNFTTLDAATGAPTGCNLSFTNSANTGSVRALNVSPDGSTLYVGGSFTIVGGVGGFTNLAAINTATCTAIPTFRPQVAAQVYAVASDANNVYIGGEFVTVAGQSHSRIAKISTAGVTDSMWSPVLDAQVRALAVAPDDKLIVGGQFNTVNGGASRALTVLSASTGAPLKLFGSFIESRSAVKSIAVDPDGSAFYLGNEGTGTGAFDGRTAVSLNDYSQIWRDTCLGATQSVVYYQGNIYSGSHAHDCGSMGEYPNGKRQHLVAEAAKPPASTASVPQPQLQPWYPDTNDGIGEQIGPRALTVARSGSSDYLWVVGEFTTVNGKAQQGITRFGTAGDKNAPSAPVLSVVSYRAGQALVRFRAGVDNDDRTLNYSVYRDGATTPFWTGTVDSSWWKRPQVTIIDNQAATTTHTYAVTASDGVNTTQKAQATASVRVGASQLAYTNLVNTDGATGVWRMDEPGTTFAADAALVNNNSAPKNNNATYPVAVNGVAGVTYGQAGALLNDSGNKAALLNGVGNVYTEQRQPTPGAFSVEMWFKTTSTTGGKLFGFADAQSALSTQYDRQVFMTNDGRLQFGVYSGGKQSFTTTQKYNNGAWHHMVATQGPSGMALYVDKVLVGTRSTATAQAYTFGGFWRFGGDSVAGWPYASTSAFFKGSIDEVSVYNKALTSAQVTAHWKASGRS